jgi:hypothetical protein
LDFRLVYTPSSSGDFFIAADGYRTSAGTYTLRVSSGRTSSLEASPAEEETADAFRFDDILAANLYDGEVSDKPTQMPAGEMDALAGVGHLGFETDILGGQQPPSHLVGQEWDLV